MEDDARPAVVPREQLVDDEEGLALAGVAAEEDDGLVGAVEELVGGLGLLEVTLTLAIRVAAR